MRKRLLVANWKMNKSYNELEPYVMTLQERKLFSHKTVDIVLAPPFPFLEKLGQHLKDSGIGLAAQNVHAEPKGAFTGEVSVHMLHEVGVTYTIVGHSERRQFFGEKDSDISKKVRACLNHGMKPILCVGESLEERTANHTFAVIERQIESALEGLETLENLVMAYEPVWAIGTGVSASVEQAQTVHNFIRTWVEKKFGKEESQRLQILYGGSMNLANIKDLVHQKDIDGGLVGGASLDAKIFSDMVKEIS